MEELKKEIKRTDIELDDTKNHKEKIEELKSLIPTNIRLQVMRKRYDWAISNLQPGTSYLEPELEGSLYSHLETVQTQLDNLQSKYRSRINMFKEKSVLSY